MEMALGIDLCKSKDSTPTAAGVVIGTPILCGPGAITTVMLLSKDYGILIPLIAITLCLAVTWVILYYSAAIQNLLGTVITDIMGRVLGMLVAAIAIKIIFSGIVGTLGLPITI